MKKEVPLRLAAHTLMLLFSVLSALPTTHAFVFPRKGNEYDNGFETVYQYRERLGLVYNYTPSLINAEMCRYLTEKECQSADKSMQEHAKAHQETQKALYRQRRRLQDTKDFQKQLGAFTKAYANPAKQTTLEEELEELEQLLQDFNTTQEEHYRQRRRLQGPTKPSDRTKAVHNPSVGSFVVPLLLMRFTDHANRPLPEKYHYQILWNLRIKKWLDENSYGRYYAFFDVQDWEMTDNTEQHYSSGKAGRTSEFSTSFYPLLNSMDARLEGDWSLYDVNGDGYIDNLVVIHSGYGAEEAGEDCTNGRQYTDRIWSHAFSNSDGWVSSSGDYRVRGYNVASALNLVCGSDTNRMGVMTHEYLHTFYLIDLYDLQNVGNGVGNFDIMGYPFGVANDGYIPVNLSPWSRQTIEWQTCTVIAESGEYTIEPAAFSDNCYKIVLVDSTIGEEYILLENRQQANFDIDFWEAGLVMYHIDEAAPDQMWAGHPEPDFDDDWAWPKSGDHYRVAVIQADGAYDLERDINIGEGADLWQPGMVLGPNVDGNTYPNTEGYQSGVIEPTGIVIEALASEGMNVRVKVTMPTRSGGDDTATRPEFLTPQKEPLEPMAIEQFNDPDSEERISGMIPQLPWYQEWKDKQNREPTTIFNATQTQSGASGGYSLYHGSILVAGMTFVVASVAAMQ